MSARKENEKKFTSWIDHKEKIEWNEGIMITKKILAEQLKEYLNHKITKEELINWCEKMMQEELFEDDTVQEIVARIGLMDANNFDVSYEDLSGMLNSIGYQLKVEVV